MTAVTYSVADILRLPDGLRSAGSRADAERAGDRESVEVRSLLDRATAGDQNAFGRLIEIHQRRAPRRSRPSADAKTPKMPRKRHSSRPGAICLAFAATRRSGPGCSPSRGARRSTAGVRDSCGGSDARWSLPPMMAICLPRSPVSSPDPKRTAVARETAHTARREIARLSPTLREDSVARRVRRTHIRRKFQPLRHAARDH